MNMVWRKYFRAALPFVGLAGIFLFHGVSNYLWLNMNRLPPHDDLAIHLSAGFGIVDDDPHSLLGMVIRGFRYQVGDFFFYPPLFHIVMACFIALFGRSEVSAIMTNLPFLLVALMALYYTGRKINQDSSGLLAGFVLMAYPYVFDLSRLALPDFALLSMVALSFCLLLYTDDFSRRGRSIVFGLSLGVGMMTKQVFVLFLLPSVAFVAAAALWHGSGRRKTVLANLGWAIVAGVSVCGYWYLPRLPELWRNYVLAGFHEDAGICSPEVLNTQSLLFYPKALVERQILVVFSLLFACALPVMFFFGKSAMRLKLLLTTALAGSGVLFLLIFTKETKTTTPCLVFIALITAFGIVSVRQVLVRRALIAATVVFGMAQYLYISYPVDRWVTRLFPERFETGASPFRIGGLYRPAATECEIPAVAAFIRAHAGGVLPVTVVLMYDTMNTAEKHKRLSSIAANFSAFSYASARLQMPFNVRRLDNTMRAAPDFAVVSDYMDADYHQRMQTAGYDPGRIAARFRLVDNSGVLIYAVSGDHER